MNASEVLRIIMLVSTHCGAWLAGIYFGIHASCDVVFRLYDVILPLNIVVLLISIACFCVIYRIDS